MGDGRFLASSPAYGNDWIRLLIVDKLNIFVEEIYFNNSLTSYCTQPSKQSCIISGISPSVT